MIVPVMRIRKMFMIVSHRQVCVLVSMAGAGRQRGVGGVPVMFVVFVLMHVDDSRMPVEMTVTFRHVQPDAETHQGAGTDQPGIDALGQQGNREHCAEKKWVPPKSTRWCGRCPGGAARGRTGLG